MPPPAPTAGADATGGPVAAADATVVPTELQRPGGKRLPAADFLRGFDLKAGQVFG